MGGERGCCFGVGGVVLGVGLVFVSLVFVVVFKGCGRVGGWVWLMGVGGGLFGGWCGAGLFLGGFVWVFFLVVGFVCFFLWFFWVLFFWGGV